MRAQRQETRLGRTSKPPVHRPERRGIRPAFFFTVFGVLVLTNVLALTALLPVLLEGMPLTPAMQQEALLRIDGGCVLAQPAAQGEVRKLFDLLNTGLLRRLTTGVGKPWNEAGADDIRHFLDRWRGSSIGLFNAGYRVLVKFACVAYFGQAASRQVSGYPGPLAAMYQAVNA